MKQFFTPKMAHKNGLFPLRLAHFERYMLADDSPEYPMVIAVKARLQGEIDRPVFESAFKKVLETNPLLTSKIEKREGDYYWIPTDPVKIKWDHWVPTMVRLDLFQVPGVKVFANSSGSDCELTLFIHHSVADAGGICQMLEDWLTYYGHLRSEDETRSSVRQLARDRNQSNARLPLRGKFGMNFFKYLLRMFQEFCGVLGVIEYFSHRPVALGPQSVQHHPGRDSLSHEQTVMEFSTGETQQVLSDSKSTRYKINDMMIASMYDACYHWLQNHHPEEAHRHLRIMIPMDMRSKTNPEKYIANNVSMIFLDRRPGRYRSVRSLCGYVWLEMTVIKAMKLGLTLMHLISFYRFRKKLPSLLRRDRCITTMILSNMGHLFPSSGLRNAEGLLESSGLTMVELNMFPPVRPYTWLACLVDTYGKKIKVSANWCSGSLNPEDVLEILTRFKDNLLAAFTNKQTGTQNH